MVVRGLADLEDQSDGGRSSGMGGARAVPSGGVAPMALPVLPSIKEIMFPQARWRSFIGVMSTIDVVMFLITLIVGATRDGAFVKANSMAGPSSQTLLAMGAIEKLKLIKHYEVWRLFSAVVLHAGLLHIGLNLVFQCNIGFVYEALWGTSRMAVIYWVSGVGASLTSATLGEAISVGASGALMGLLGAIISYIVFNWNELPDAPQVSGIGWSRLLRRNVMRSPIVEALQYHHPVGTQFRAGANEHRD